MAAHLAQLCLTGFKSFADPATLDILPGLTGLVGLNGCGRSNLAEALRWTMGGRSGWASSFAASLELTKQGQVTLAQDGAFAPILVNAAPEPGTNNPCAGHPGRHEAVPAPQR